MPKLQPDDLRAANRLLVEATVGTTDLVDAVHASVLGWPRRIVGLSPQPASGGIPGLVYAAIRGIARLAGDGVDLALRQLPAAPGDDAPDPQREALVAALNGVLGDHLVATGNPLAITPRLRKDGVALTCSARRWPAPSPPRAAGWLVLIHGLCMNDLQWRQGGHDHGAALADALDCDVVHLHYNSGLPIADNGRVLDTLLQALADAWPQPLARIALVGHSMGGLVARAAIAHAQDAGSGWLATLTDVATLGTPFHGAALERAGHLLEQALGVSAHSAPFATLGKLRSAGVRDLRHGGAHLQQPPLPAQVRAYAIAGSIAATSTGTRRPRGDGLVSVASAFGEHRDPRRRLSIRDDHKRLVYATGHIALLGSAEVCAQLRDWLA